MGPREPSEGWYFNQGDVLLGPVTTAELKRLAERGQLTCPGAIWREWLLRPPEPSPAGRFAGAGGQGWLRRRALG
jgi:hypothetical protein